MGLDDGEIRQAQRDVVRPMAEMEAVFPEEAGGAL